MIWPRIQISGPVWISTRTVGIETQRTRMSARLKLRRKRLVELRKSRLFQMTTGTRQLPTRPTTRMILHATVIMRLMWAGSKIALPPSPSVPVPVSVPAVIDDDDDEDEDDNDDELLMPGEEVDQSSCSIKSFPLMPPPPLSVNGFINIADRVEALLLLPSIVISFPGVVLLLLLLLLLLPSYFYLIKCTSPSHSTIASNILNVVDVAAVSPLSVNNK